MKKRNKFLIGVLTVTFLYIFPLASAILLQILWLTVVVLVGFFGSIYLIYRYVYVAKPKYPMVPPEGQPDMYYRFRIPRPIYEDVEQHPEFFKKRKQKWMNRTRKVKKKH